MDEHTSQTAQRDADTASFAQQMYPPVNRRAFLMTSLMAGFSLAVQPVKGQVISTTAEGIVAGEVKIPVADGEMPGYRAHPQHGGPFPTVVVIQEIFGVHEYIRDIVRRFAKLGYYAVTAELYARQGDVAKMADIDTIIGQVVRKVPDRQVVSDIDAALAFAKASGAADTRRLGVTGFCWGGRATWVYAAHNPAVKAAVAWYGPLDGWKTEFQQPDPLQLAPKIQVPVLGLYAGDDTFITQQAVDAMRAALKKAGSKSELVVFPGVPHGFHADYRPTYRKQEAELAWGRMLKWFQSHGVA